jgi:tetratricopeptide (TPR) repeat protein
MWLRVLLLSSVVALGQHAHSHDDNGKGSAAALPQTGDYAFPVATQSQEAQRFFSAGMALIYGFNHDEAQRLFRRAAELDPASPMPHWGMALSLGSHINNEPEAEREKKAWEAIARAQSLAVAAPTHEKRYVAALSARYSSDPKADRKQLARAYATAMESLHKDYPDDPDAATLYAESLMNLNPWKYWDAAGKPAPETLRFVEVLEGVLRRWPDHPGANHYYIHAVEASPQPERALAAANRLGRLVPAAGHLVHMPSHIYARLGHWEEAATANVAAVAADKIYLKDKPAAGLYPLMYHPHNIHFLVYASGAAGQCADAEKSGRDLVAQVSPGLDAMPMLQMFVAYTYQLPVWCPSLALPAAPAEKFAVSTVAYQYARGTRAAWGRDVAGAKAALNAMRAAAKQVAPETIYEPAYTAAYLRVATASLEARIADAEGDLVRAAELWRTAVRSQDELRYDEPPIWFYQVRQSLGAVLLRMGRAAEAEAVLRESLRLQPRDGRVLFLLTKALEAQRKQREASLVETEFRAVWRGGSLSVNEL